MGGSTSAFSGSVSLLALHPEAGKLVLVEAGEGILNRQTSDVSSNGAG